MGEISEIVALGMHLSDELYLNILINQGFGKQIESFDLRQTQLNLVHIIKIHKYQ